MSEISEPEARPLEICSADYRKNMIKLNPFIWKGIVVEGEKRAPMVPRNAKYYISYKAFWEGESKPFISSACRRLKLLNEYRNLRKIFEFVLRTMRVGERANVLILHQCFSNAKTAWFPEFRRRTNILLIIKLLSFSVSGQVYHRRHVGIMRATFNDHFVRIARKRKVQYNVRKLQLDEGSIKLKLSRSPNADNQLNHLKCFYYDKAATCIQFKQTRNLALRESDCTQFMKDTLSRLGYVYYLQAQTAFIYGNCKDARKYIQLAAKAESNFNIPKLVEEMEIKLFNQLHKGLVLLDENDF